jgi:hypothetical protein
VNGKREKITWSLGKTSRKNSKKPLRHPLTSKMLLHGAHSHQGHTKKRKRQRKGSQIECPKP